MFTNKLPIKFILIILLSFPSATFALNINNLVYNELRKDGTFLNMIRSGVLDEKGVKALAKSPLLNKVETLGRQ